MAAARHILVLVDRDWTHPQAGGTGTVLRAQVTRWVDAGHRVTVIAGSYDGAEPVSRPHERIAVHRMGTRLTVFPRAAWATLRGLGRDADVVLEVCNGIAFFTTFWRWLRQPRVLTVIHVVYMGLDGEHFAPGDKAPDPALVYLGRLKAYKRIEHVLDVAGAIPGAH